MRRSVLALGIIVIILVAVAVFYYSSLVSASHFNNGNVSFDYPNSFSLDKTQVSTENSSGYFVGAISSPSRTSAIVIYQIPLTTTKNVTSNQTQNVSSSTPSGNASNNSTSNNTTVITSNNTTILVKVDNLQAYLDQVKNRGGNPQKVIKNNYTDYVSGNLSAAFVNYNSSSRTGNVTFVTINETAIVKDGFSNFYVIELLSGDNTSEASNAYTQIVNSLRING